MEIRAFTLLATVGAKVIDVIESVIKVQPLEENSLVQLETVAIVYFAALLYFIERGWEADMENIIRMRRKALGLSQKELAKRCGVSTQTVNAIENNKYDPTLALAFRLAGALQLLVDALFFPDNAEDK